MSRLSMNEMTTYRWSFEEDVLQYRQAGIMALGVWRQKLADYGEEKGAELLAELGMGVSNLLWAGGFTGSEGRSYRESVEDAVEAIHLASHLQAGCLVLYTGARNGHTHSHARRLFQGALKELAPIAAQQNVKLAVEPMHPGCAQEWTFLTSIEETLSLVDAVDSAQIGLVFDTYHLGFDREVIEQIPQLVERIRVVHLGDGRAAPQGEQNRCPLGEGELPLAEIIAALTEAGYEGDYDVELMGEEIETSSYGELIEHSVHAFERLVGSSPRADRSSLLRPIKKGP